MLCSSHEHLVTGLLLLALVGLIGKGKITVR